jgi:hypothetical protein
MPRIWISFNSERPEFDIVWVRGLGFGVILALEEREALVLPFPWQCMIEVNTKAIETRLRKKLFRK